MHPRYRVSSTARFQSTHLHEVRLSMVSERAISCMFQSTHLHEVRLTATEPVLLTSEFQSTHLHEVRRIFSNTSALPNSEFQSTHLHEVRPCRGGKGWWYSCFNPRTYMRCDSSLLFLVSVPTCFNPRTYMRCDYKPIRFKLDY